MNDDAAPDMPLFLSDEADAAKQRRSFPIRKMVFAILAALTLEAAVVALGYPVARLAAVSASLVDASEANKDSVAPPPQSTVEAQASPPAESDAPASPPTTATTEPAAPEAASPAPAEQQGGAKAASDGLFMQFQAWAQRQDGGQENKPDPQQDPGQPSQAQQVTQDVAEPPVASEQPVAPAQPVAPKQSAETMQAVPARTQAAAPVPVRTAQKQRPVRELRNARAEMEAARTAARAKAAHGHDVPARTQSRDDSRPPDAPAQSSQTPSLLQMLGLR